MKGKVYRHYKLILFLIPVIIFVFINIFPLSPNYVWYAKSRYKQIVKVEEKPNQIYSNDYRRVIYHHNQNNNQTLVAGLRSIDDSVNRYYSFLESYDQNDNLAWSLGGEEGITYENYYIDLYDVTEKNNGAIIGVAKITSQLDPYVKDFALIKVSVNGKIEWLKTFDDYYNEAIYSDTDHPRLYIVKSTTDGYSIIINDKLGMTIIRFDLNDKLVWKSKITHPYRPIRDERESTVIRDIVINQDNELYIATSSQIVMFSESGEKKWNKHYEFLINGLFIDQHNSLYVIGDVEKQEFAIKKIKYFVKEIYIVEEYYKYDYPHHVDMTNGVISKINTNDGREVWYDEYNTYFNRYVSFNEIKEVDDDLIILTNSGELVKYSKDGKVLGNIRTNIYFSGILSDLSMLMMDVNEYNIHITINDKLYTIRIDQLNWENVKKFDYEYAVFYQSLIPKKIFYNRVFLITYAIIVPIVLIRKMNNSYEKRE